MDQQYIRDQYHQAMLEYKAAINEDAQWEARRTMARLEALAIEMFGESFQKELREQEQIEPEAAQEAGIKRAPRRYRQGTDGQVRRSWNGKLPEEFSEKDALAFLADTDLQLNGTISQDTLAALDQAGYIYKDGLVQAKELQPEQPSETSRFVKEYAGKIEKLVEDNKNFPVEDSGILPFEISNGSHAAVRYAYISKNSTFEDMQAAESEVELNVTAAIYRDGTLNEYDQGIEERKFVIKGTDAINDFLEKLGQSVTNGIKKHPDIQPVVTVNFSEYDNYNPLVKDHMRLTLDRANSLFELINIVAGDAGAKGHKSSYQTSADIMYVQDGQIRHFDLRQEFGKSGSIIKHIEGYIDDRIKYWEKQHTKPDWEAHLKQWETAKKELIPYFERHISLSSAERDLAYLGKAAPVMQDHIFEMRAFLNTGMIVPAPERDQPEKQAAEDEQEADPVGTAADNLIRPIEPTLQESTEKDEPAPEEKHPDRVYLSLPPVRKEKFPAILQELKQNGAKFDKERKQWYADRAFAESGVFNAYLWTYLTLPSMKREEYLSMLDQMKQDGARFDRKQKKWYIDGNCDRDKFLTYLESGPQEQIPVTESRLETAQSTESGEKEIAQEAATAGMTVEEYVANGYEPYAVLKLQQETEPGTTDVPEKSFEQKKFYKVRQNPYSDSPENSTILQEYVTQESGMAKLGDILYTGTPEKCGELLRKLETGELTPGDIKELSTQEKTADPQSHVAEQLETTVTYYPINEAAAKRAKEAISYSDYKPGSATAEYRHYVDEAAGIAARQKKSVAPSFHEKIDGLLDAYARKLAANMNKRYEIIARVPSILITGGSNFPVRKKEKQNAAADKNMQEFTKIQGLLEKICSTGMGGISADDPDAVSKLESKLAKLEQAQETMKAVNAYYRKNKTLDGCPHLLPGQLEKLKEAMARPDGYQANQQPFESYQLSNNNAEIHRIKDRIATLTRRIEIGFVGWEFDGGHVEANTADNRLQVFFDEKPAQEVRESLKGSGFRYAPSVGAWQRQLTDNAIHAADRIRYIQPLTGERPTELQKRAGQEATLQKESGGRNLIPGQVAPDTDKLDPASGKRSSVLGQLEKAKETAPGSGTGDQARGARLPRHEKAI